MLYLQWQWQSIQIRCWSSFVCHFLFRNSDITHSPDRGWPKMPIQLNGCLICVRPYEFVLLRIHFEGLTRHFVNVLPLTFTSGLLFFFSTFLNVWDWTWSQMTYRTIYHFDKTLYFMYIHIYICFDSPSVIFTIYDRKIYKAPHLR